MSEVFLFHPPRQRSLIFLGGSTLLLASASVASLVIGLKQEAGYLFVGLLLLSLALFAPLPMFLYRVYALLRASYRLERDGLRLRWGLRAEDIPLPEIEWVRKASDLASDLPLPALAWPGALRGTVRVRDLGAVEYMASTRRTLILVATAQKVYALSPEDPNRFLQSFRRSLELGSLDPISPASVLPVTYLNQIWRDRLARWILLGAFLLTILLFAGAGLVITGQVTIPLGFYPNGQPLPPGPAEQLLLLPILGAFVFLIDLAAGLFFYRRQLYRLLAYLVWGAGAATQSLLLIALLRLVQIR